MPVVGVGRTNRIGVVVQLGAASRLVGRRRAGVADRRRRSFRGVVAVPPLHRVAHRHRRGLRVLGLREGHPVPSAGRGLDAAGDTRTRQRGRTGFAIACDLGHREARRRVLALWAPARSSSSTRGCWIRRPAGAARACRGRRARRWSPRMAWSRRSRRGSPHRPHTPRGATPRATPPRAPRPAGRGTSWRLSCARRASPGARPRAGRRGDSRRRRLFGSISRRSRSSRSRRSRPPARGRPGTARADERARARTMAQASSARPSRVRSAASHRRPPGTPGTRAPKARTAAGGSGPPAGSAGVVQATSRRRHRPGLRSPHRAGGASVWRALGGRRPTRARVAGWWQRVSRAPTLVCTSRDRATPSALGGSGDGKPSTCAGCSRCSTAASSTRRCARDPARRRQPARGARARRAAAARQAGPVVGRAAARQRDRRRRGPRR